MLRSFDPEVMQKAMEPYPDLNPPDYDYDSWVSNLKNVMLVENEDVGLATYEYPGVYTGHFFLVSRGKEAVKVAEKLIDTMFDEYKAKVMRGLVKLDNKKSRWMCRHLGFQSLGNIETTTGLHELFTLTKDDFYGRC